MKHKLFMLSLVIGVLALLNYANAEVIFWTQKPIESEAGKIAWIVISVACLILFLALAVREYRRKNGQSST
jgi:hypothetical protein